MLQRMDELATKAANGTMSQSDRQNVQDEIDSLLTEIDRVSETTKFNETYLLKGSATTTDGSFKMNLSAKSAGINGKFVFDNDASVLNADTKTSISQVTFKLTDEEIEKINNLQIGDTYDIGGTVLTIVSTQNALFTASDGTVKSGAAAKTDLNNSARATQIAFDGTSTDRVNLVNAIANKMADALTRANQIGTIKSNDTSHFTTVQAPTTIKMDGNKVASGGISFSITKANVSIQSPLSLSLHVGADSLASNKIDLQINKMNTRGLGIEGLKVTGTSAQNATFAIDAIQDAINRVSSQRSALGAVQNRLEHTIKNVDNVIENTTSAESAIRDTDMATEMVKFSNANILQQAGQSMLAQANQSNQGVLSILG